MCHYQFSDSFDWIMLMSHTTNLIACAICAPRIRRGVTMIPICVHLKNNRQFLKACSLANLHACFTARTSMPSIFSPQECICIYCSVLCLNLKRQNRCFFILESDLCGHYVRRTKLPPFAHHRSLHSNNVLPCMSLLFSGIPLARILA